MELNYYDPSILVRAKQNEHLLPTPDYLDQLIAQESISMFDLVIHRGVSGTIFHHYQMEYINRLAAVGITTMLQLSEEYKKVQQKTSKLPSSMRSIVKGHYGYYYTRIKELKELFNSTENKVVNGNSWYIIDNHETGTTEITPEGGSGEE